MSGTPDWSQGYVTDTLYTENHYREMSPAWINYVAVLNGCLPRSVDRDFAYLELGCGHGRTLTHLAAAFPKGRFFGVDFNPAHIDSAQRYAAALGIGNVRFLECGFQIWSASRRRPEERKAGQRNAGRGRARDGGRRQSCRMSISSHCTASIPGLVRKRAKPCSASSSSG